MVYRIYVEKKEGLQNEASSLLSEIKTFEDFYFAFLKQWEYLIEQSMKITNDAERFLAFVNLHAV